MKRTGEIVLISIGIFLNLIGVALFGFLTTLSHTPIFRDNFEEGFNEGLAEDGFEAVELTGFFSVISGFGWLLSILSVVGIIIGILAIFFLVGNKKPKASGIMLIAFSAIYLVSTLFMGFFTFLVYLIAGIMALVRKPPQAAEEEPEIIEIQ